MEILLLHGLPSDIVSDRDTRFVAGFRSDTCKLLGTKMKMSTSFQPETDGQTERVNQTVEQYLRNYANDKQNNWVEMLALAEFAYNNSLTSATGLSPFYANYRF